MYFFFQNYIELSRPHVKVNTDSFNANSSSENKVGDINYAVITSIQPATTSGLSNQSYGHPRSPKTDRASFDNVAVTVEYSDISVMTDENLKLIEH